MFPKILEKKKYSLNRSYFKLCYWEMPKDPYECMQYYQEHNKRPFSPFGYDQKEIIYSMFCERQKKWGQYDMKSFDQFYTPPKTAKRMVELMRDYGTPKEICDACCGYWSITQFIETPNTVAWSNHRFNLFAFDMYKKNSDFVKNTQSWLVVENQKFQETNWSWDCIISNPPYWPLPEFLERVHKSLKPWWYCVLLVPRWYMGKERPKALMQTIQKFDVLHREQMQESFANTAISCDIYVLRPL